MIVEEHAIEVPHLALVPVDLPHQQRRACLRVYGASDQFALLNSLVALGTGSTSSAYVLTLMRLAYRILNK